MGNTIIVDYSKLPVFGYEAKKGIFCGKKLDELASHLIVFHSKKSGEEKIDLNTLRIQKLKKGFFKENIKDIIHSNFPDLVIMNEMYGGLYKEGKRNATVPDEWEKIKGLFHFFGTVLRENKDKGKMVVPFLNFAKKEGGYGDELCFGGRFLNEKGELEFSSWDKDDYVVCFKNQILQEEPA